MGFFSDLIMDEKKTDDFPKEKEKDMSYYCEDAQIFRLRHPYSASREHLKTEVLKGLRVQLSEAMQIYRVNMRQKFMTNLLICGPRGSGKSLFAREFMRINGICFCVIDPDEYADDARLEDFLRRMIAEGKRGFIFDDIDRAETIPACIEDIMMREGPGEGLHGDLITICTATDKVPDRVGRLMYRIRIAYGMADLEDLFLKFAEEVIPLSKNNIKIDGRAIEALAARCGWNMNLFRSAVHKLERSYGDSSITEKDLTPEMLANLGI